MNASLRHLARTLLAVACATAVEVAHVRPGHADSCPNTRSAGVDIAEWSNWAYGWRGIGIIQTFFAEDTLISALTFWRSIYEDSLFFPLHLYIGETDSTGMPLTDRILVDWPELLEVYGDGITPTEYRVEFNPPIAVPRRDTLAFYLVSYPCDGWFNIYAAEGDFYVGGSSWQTLRPWGQWPCGLRPGPRRFPAWDLCFRVEFCDTPMPTRRSTWGELKVRYR